VKDNTCPVFHRPVSFAIKGAVEDELKYLESAGIIEKVSHSDWAAIVPKGDGKFRICGDYKVTVNPHLDIDQYPLPKPDDLFASLAGGQRFSKIDLPQAYQQMVLDKESRESVTDNTHLTTRQDAILSKVLMYTKQG